jgi:hypothetical protein
MKKLIYDKIEINTKRVSINLVFYNRLTVVIDKSATGKSLIANTLVDYSKNHESYRNISYIDASHDNTGHSILDSLKMTNNRFIIIDRADILLDKETRDYIFFDQQNQYLIFGRGLDELICSSNQIVTVHREITTKPTLSFDYLIGGGC